MNNGSPAGSWHCVASSADGEELVAGDDSGGGVWVYQAAPTPQMDLAQADGNLALSWLIPSTNFIVQQSLDLISWSSITDKPVLNLTNLNYDMKVVPSNSSGFFRLVS